MPASRAAAQRYARALFSLASDLGQVEGVGRELGQLVELTSEQAELRDVLLRPLYPAAQRRAVLAAVAGRLGLSPLFANFCQFLIDQRRTQELEVIREEFDRLAEEAAGQIRGTVTSAAPLSPSQLDQLRALLAERTGRTVELASAVDPALLGGAIARVGDLVYDGSLRSRLDQLRAELTGRD